MSVPVIDLSTPEGRAALPSGVTWSPVSGFSLPGELARTKIGEAIDEIRKIRDMKIDSVSWAADRHLREIRLCRSTTLTADEARDLDEYIQALCDFPEMLDFGSLVPAGGLLDALPWPQIHSDLMEKVLRKDGGLA